MWEYGYYGQIMYEPLLNFEEKTGIKLNIVYFKMTEDMEKQLIEDEKNGCMPDVVLIDYYTYGQWDRDDNVYRMIDSGLFYDMSGFVEMDGVYESEEYYNEVLKGGIWNDKQWMLPIEFNVNTIFASQEKMDSYGIALTEDMTYKQIIDELFRSISLCGNEVEALTYIGDNYGSFQKDLMELLCQASGRFPIDYETMTVTIDRDVFEEIAELYKTYIMAEAGDDYSLLVEEAAKDDELNRRLSLGIDSQWKNRRSWWGYQDDIGDWLDSGLFLLEGGGGLQMDVHSFVGQATFLESCYNYNNEDLFMMAIPSVDNNQYVGMITLCGAVSKDTEYPYNSYKLIRYLMDQESFPYYTLSVNRNTTEAMLEELSKATYELDPGYGTFEDIEKSPERTYYITPISKELKEKIEKVLDNLGTAQLPNFSAYVPFEDHIAAYAVGKETMDEAYEAAVSETQEAISYLFGK
jgi:ABC-type glycerol-3-phosphate transport system substrate-binding protein